MTGQPLVSLGKQANYNLEEVKSEIEKLLTPFGGMRKYISKDSRVVLKPNLVRACPDNVPTCTNPVIFQAVAELALDHSANVVAGDSPGMGTARSVASKSGLLTIADKLGIEFIEFTPKDVFSEKRQFKKLTLSKELLEADTVINLPRLKTHAQMLLTAATKNLFGAVIGTKKFEWHYKAGHDKINFARMIYEISDCIKPDLHILDAIIAMDGMGPTSGTPNHTGFLAVGEDPLAIDATMMDILGREPEKLYILQAAEQAGNITWKERKATGASIADLKPEKWRWPKSCGLGIFNFSFLQKDNSFSKLFRRMAAVYPQASKTKCTKCNACVKLCPAKAMTLGKDRVEIDYDKCIRCFCCHELCPHDAMETKGGILPKLLGKLAKHL